MDMNYLNYFRQLAETESYTRAAQLLNITQPSLSYVIRKLENELGFPLFVHQGRNIRLSEAGKIYYPYVCSALSQLAAGKVAVQSVASQKQSFLGITKTMAYERLHYTLIEKFNQEWPMEAGRVEAKSYNSSSEIHKAILEESLMAGICLSSDDPGLLQFPIWPRSMDAICAISHPLASRDRVTCQELLPYTFAFGQVLSKRTFQYFSSLAEEFHVPFHYRFYGESIDLAYIASYENVVAITPLDIHMEHYPYHSCKITDYPYDLTLHLTIRKDSERDSREMRFWQTCRRFVKEHSDAKDYENV